jgi:hypothetical protein
MTVIIASTHLEPSELWALAQEFLRYPAPARQARGNNADLAAHPTHLRLHHDRPYRRALDRSSRGCWSRFAFTCDLALDARRDKVLESRYSLLVIATFSHIHSMLESKGVP